MGYCIKLVSKKEILESDVKSIIHNMPDYLRGPLNKIKEQEWGWPCICDIHKPIGQELTISGAYAMSGNKAEDFTAYMQHALDELGYDVDILYTDTVAKMAENLKDFNEKTTTSFKHAAEAMSNFGVKAADLVRNGVLKDSCSHCGADMKEANTKYCERCYQLLVAENAELQLKMKKRIPEENVIFFMSKLRELIIKPQTNKYGANDKLKDIADLYLKHINKLGGIKYESND